MSSDLKTDPIEGGEMLRELLTRLRKEAQQRIIDLRRDQEQESDAGPADEMDSASTTEEIETHAGLIARAEEKLRYLDEAFARLDAGKYGRCLKCGGAIPIERLMAIPFASYCVDCQKELHRARGGWGQGTTIAPFDHQWTLPEEMEVPTDRLYQSTDPEEQLTISARQPLPPGEPENQAKRKSARKTPTPGRKK
ncbi:MAG: TraR/DksA family transcriptional regulator [Candidatus Binatus sp.]|uniref:TraR/DksA family transcriptional regulator n=1 Tax=Candidatus Binatus sp. TaxID=2811406 RepID=UPI0027226970|nr:TraR/DksA family transcriptional regulator [Candidatus Binatus sp.]MDO8430997.1 TraR/DksA family transcriptional regulator [Candidatus Binatus sp.]